MLQTPNGTYTIHNYGRRINCTVSIIFPESFRIVQANIGSCDTAMTNSNNLVETGVMRQVSMRFALCRPLSCNDSCLQSPHVPLITTPRRHNMHCFINSHVFSYANQCKEKGESDYVEIRGGDGLDPDQMEVVDNFCGIDSKPGECRL